MRCVVSFEKKVKSKLKKALTIVAAAFFLVVSFVIGYSSAELMDEFDMGSVELVILLLGVYIITYISIILHEAGHLIFGLASGYRFCSFRIGSFMWIKQNGKIRFRRFSLAGTGGQCLMTPPEEKNGRIPVILFNFGGVIVNVIFTLILLISGLLAARIPLLSLILKIGALISFIFSITNGIPINAGGIANDGMNALHLSKNPDAADAFRKQLLANAAQTEGKRISEMPDEWFTLPDGADMQNVHCASLAVFAVSRHLDRGDTITAEEEIERLLHSNYNIIGLHKNLLTCDLISVKLINNPETDVSSYLSTELNKLMQSMKSYPSIIRTQYIIALLSDKDEDKAAEILASFDKKTAKFPYRQEIETEKALMSKALDLSKNEI